jgi:hypothetical protein
MALCFVTQIVENNYSVVDSNVKLRSLNCVIFQPSARCCDCGVCVHLQGAPRSEDVEIRWSRPSNVRK